MDEVATRITYHYAEVTLAERPTIKFRCPDCGSVMEEFSWERWSRRVPQAGLIRNCPSCHLDSAEPSFRGTGVLDDSTQE